MLKQTQSTLQFILLFAVVFISRIPFLSAGYGTEEDSWGMINAMQRFHDSGIYEVSRFPGHPVLEFCFYALIGKSYFVFNLLTAIISTAGIVLFAACLKMLGFRKFFWSALSLAFIPVVFIKCTDTMDYMWALSFMMLCLFFILRSRQVSDNFNARFYLFAAGIALGLATGARFTSILFFIPLQFLYLDLSRNESRLRGLIFTMSFLISVFICFLPVISIYNPKTFYVPYILGRPDLIKTMYKASIGVFGLPASLLLPILIAYILLRFKNRRKFSNPKIFMKSDPKLPVSRFLKFTLLSFILYVALFVWQPHKSAYLIAALPFLVMLIEHYSNEHYSMRITLALAFSSFFAGINLEDNYRGAPSSFLSAGFNISGQHLTFDVLRGPIIADNQRRKQQLEFAETVIENVKSIDKPTAIIAGWWINQLEVLTGKGKNESVTYYYFMDENQMQQLKNKGAIIYYLPQQEQVNDLRWQKQFTAKYALPLFNDNTRFLF